MTVKRIGVLSCGKVLGILYGFFGLIFGAIFSLFAVVGGLAGAANNQPEALFGLFFGVGAVIFVPVFYGVMGFLSGLLTAAVYNVIASVAGGLELELE